MAREGILVGEASAPVVETGYSAKLAVSRGPETSPCPTILGGKDQDDDGDDDAISVKTVTTDLILSTDSPPYTEWRTLGLSIVRNLGWSGYKRYDYDVITVHGIRDDYKTAWIDNEGEWWVREGLCEAFLARQIDYSYEINEDSDLYTTDRIRLHAEKLISEYAEVRRELEETQTYRPIIWICHDLGGTIVKEARSMALANPNKYGGIAMLTTCIVFLGTPHRCGSVDDLEDQLLRLVQLPGPRINNRVSKKARCLANQVERVNTAFLETKLFDRAVIFNIFSQDIYDYNISDQEPADRSMSCAYAADGLWNHDTPMHPKTSHLDLVKGDGSDEVWLSEVAALLNSVYCPIYIDRRMIQFQTQILSLVPPTQLLSTADDPSLPGPVAANWIFEHKTFKEFKGPTSGFKIIHLHGSESSAIDISKISQYLFVKYDAFQTILDRRRDGCVHGTARVTVYFEFDAGDSRRNSLSSMLSYFINTLLWRIWPDNVNIVTNELAFLGDTKSWSLEDLYHVYCVLAMVFLPSMLTVFVGCVDQCPEDQRKWFLDRVLEEQAYSDGGYKLILSTSNRDGLAVESFPDTKRINVRDCQEFNKPISTESPAEEFQSALLNLMQKRPIYRSIRLQLENLLSQCNGMPHLGHIILNWLGHYRRGGATTSDMSKILKRLSPVTASNTALVFVSSLKREDQLRAMDIFNWVKYAAEPWTPESLVEALAVHNLCGTESLLSDLDHLGFIHDIEKIFCGIITIQNRDIKFSHPSFHGLADFGIGETAEEQAAKVHGEIAASCLRYFQLRYAQEQAMAFSPEHLEGGVWVTLLDSVVISHQRTSMAEYAVRFWPQHYKASGRFKPIELVHKLFSDRAARAAWEVPFFTMSNPFTRIHRSYISPLPVFAMLNLEDLMDEHLDLRKGEPMFHKDCCFALIEAARAGNKSILRKLLQIVPMEDNMLRDALFWAVARGESDTLNILLEHVPDLTTAPWPENAIYRIAASGLNNALAAAMRSGHHIDKTGTYSKAPLSTVATWRNQVSTLELLLDSDPKPDLSMTDHVGNNCLFIASKKGNPRMVELLLRAGASVDTRNALGIAIKFCRYRALELLTKASAYHKTPARPQLPLTDAVHSNSIECVRILLREHHEQGLDFGSDDHLYNKRVLPQISRDITVVYPVREHLLMTAIATDNTNLVSLLIDHDPVSCSGCSTYALPSLAAYNGNIEMVKLLLQKGVRISGEVLHSAVSSGSIELTTKLLREHGTPNDRGRDRNPCSHLCAACGVPELIAELLQRPFSGDYQCPHGSILHKAAREGYPRTIKVVLERAPKTSINLLYDHKEGIELEIGLTPLMIACRNYVPECVEVLLKAGASFYGESRCEMDVFDILMRRGGDSERAAACLRLLLSIPCQTDVRRVALIRDKRRGTLLHRINGNTLISVVQLLVMAQVPLNEEDEDGYTPLATAIASGNEGVASFLIKHGAVFDILSPGYGSILHLACATGSLSLVKLLLRSGANPTAVHPQHGESLLYTAVGIRDGSACMDMVRYLVDEAKMPLNASGGRFGYPIIRAAALAYGYAPNNIRTGILKFLIRRKADVNVADDLGRRAVHIAAKSLWEDGLRALVEAGAEAIAKDKFGRMPIHFAASAGRSNCLEYLLNLDSVIYVDVEDNDEWTPLLWAARANSPSIRIVSLLRSRGAILRSRGHAYEVTRTGSLLFRHSVEKIARWSAVNLAKFTGKNHNFIKYLLPDGNARWPEPSTLVPFASDNCGFGYPKQVGCWSCLIDIVGCHWTCVECTDKEPLCFKCYISRNTIHDKGHAFEAHGPLDYDPGERGGNEIQAKAGACTNYDLDVYLNPDYSTFAKRMFDYDLDAYIKGVWPYEKKQKP